MLLENRTLCQNSILKNIGIVLSKVKLEEITMQLL